jgi:hypothetical protein
MSSRIKSVFIKNISLRGMVIATFIMSLLALMGLFGAQQAEAQMNNSEFAWITLHKKTSMTFARYRELVLLKAADLAEARGYTHFELVDQNGYEAHGTVAARHFYKTDNYGNSSYSTLPPASHPSAIATNTEILVHFCNESEGPCRGLKAHSVMLNLPR